MCLYIMAEQVTEKARDRKAKDLESKGSVNQACLHPFFCPPTAVAVACPQAGDSPFMLRTSPVTDAALGFSLGYFATDLMLLVLYYPSFGGPEMALHHLAALASVGAAAFQARAWLLLLLLVLCSAASPPPSVRRPVEHCDGLAGRWRADSQHRLDA